MIEKKTLYPKTKRVKLHDVVEVTEKMDGSNLAMYVKDGKLKICQRNRMFDLEDLEEAQKMGIVYKGLYGFLKEYGEQIQKDIYEGSVVCGEWIGMGKIAYLHLQEEFPYRWYMFAKARLDDNLNLTNIQYYHENLKYCFNEQVIPEYVGVVPVAYTLDTIPTKVELDELYAKYCEKHQDRNVEGFVINHHDNITKYVRFKNGKASEHFDRGE